ncbi:unnamed protein product [Amoebophrya sp. A120]|nr:unnamed protein product [Amoebophrya sp. A120]|eukprot:GSA120T00004060001.1
MADLSWHQNRIRDGARGGTENFNWDSIKNHAWKDREAYLGASVKVGTMGKMSSFNRSDWWQYNRGDAKSRQEEQNTIKEFEDQLFAEALGQKPKKLLLSKQRLTAEEMKQALSKEDMEVEDPDGAQEGADFTVKGLGFAAHRSEELELKKAKLYGLTDALVDGETTGKMTGVEAQRHGAALPPGFGGNDDENSEAAARKKKEELLRKYGGGGSTASVPLGTMAAASANDEDMMKDLKNDRKSPKRLGKSGNVKPEEQQNANNGAGGSSSSSSATAAANISRDNSGESRDQNTPPLIPRKAPHPDAMAPPANASAKLPVQKVPDPKPRLTKEEQKKLKKEKKAEKKRQKKVKKEKKKEKKREKKVRKDEKKAKKRRREQLNRYRRDNSSDSDSSSDSSSSTG